MPERVLETGKIWKTLDGFDMSKAIHKDSEVQISQKFPRKPVLHAAFSPTAMKSVGSSDAGS